MGKPTVATNAGRPPRDVRHRPGRLGRRRLADLGQRRLDRLGQLPRTHGSHQRGRLGAASDGYLVLTALTGAGRGVAERPALGGLVRVDQARLRDRRVGWRWGRNQDGPARGVRPRCGWCAVAQAGSPAADGHRSPRWADRRSPPWPPPATWTAAIEVFVVGGDHAIYHVWQVGQERRLLGLAEARWVGAGARHRR